MKRDILTSGAMRLPASKRIPPLLAVPGVTPQA
jgi:hypothetical protein